MKKIKEMVFCFFRGFSTLDKRLKIFWLLLIEVTIFGLDHFTGPLISFAPYYAFPVALSAWELETFWAVCFVTLSSVARVYVFGRLFPNDYWLYAYDFFQSFLLYAGVVIGTVTIRTLVTKLKLHSKYLHSHLQQIRRSKLLTDTIRHALPEDLPNIVALASSVSKHDQAFIGGEILEGQQKQLAYGWAMAIGSGRMLRELYSGGTGNVRAEFWVLPQGNSLAGFMLVIGDDGLLGAGRELHLLAVAPMFRGLGIGSALTDFFCTHYHGRRLSVACKKGSRMMHMLKRRSFFYAKKTPRGSDLYERKA